MRSQTTDLSKTRQLVGLNRAELEQVLRLRLGITQRFRAGQLYKWIYQKRVARFSEMTDFPKQMLGELEREFELRELRLEGTSRSADGTIKFLFRLEDGRSVETVLIPSEMLTNEGEPKRRTICVSTQVGCPLDCKFCATASLKLKRNLTAGEIIQQVFEVERQSGESITNLVFMGMGEPMLNLKNVLKAIELLTDPENELLSKRRITVSTSGLPDGIRALAKSGSQVKLALSLHATNDELRSKLMPINRRYDLATVLEALDDYYRETRIPVTYEYILFEGLNDSEKDAKSLARIARRMPSKVNVIPFHPIDFTNPTGIAAELRPASTDKFERFIKLLQREGVQVMVRSSSGKDIEAACGQLALSRDHLSEEPLLNSIVLP